MKKILLFILTVALFSSACVKKLVVNPDETVNLTLDTLYAKVGDSQQIVPLNYRPDLLKWTSADTAVVSISETGFATAKKSGQSSITATTKSNTGKATCLVIVAPPISPSPVISVAGKASDIGIGADSSVFIIGIDSVSPTGGYSISKKIGSAFVKMPECAGVRIAVSPTGVPWVVNKSHLIYRYNGRLWDVMPGTANDIGIGADGSVYIIGTIDSSPTGGFNIMKWSGTDWVNMPNCAGTRIAVMPNGIPWVVNKSNIVYRNTGTDLWEPIPGVAAQDIGIGANGSVYVTGQNQSIYKYNLGNWDLLPGASGVSIAVSQQGKPWWVDNAFKIFRVN